MMRSHWLGVFGFGISAFTIACSSSSGGGNGGQGGHGGNGGHGGTTSTTSTGGTGGTVDCAALIADEEGQGTHVDVRIINHTGSDLYVRHATGFTDCVGDPPFEIKDPDGAALSYFAKGPCDSICAHYTGPATCGMTATCSPAPLTRIAPQGTITAPWEGVVRVDRTVPSACLGASAPSETTAACEAWMKPKAFPLSFTAEASTSTTCAPQGCTCTPDANGTCALAESGLLAGTKLTATASLATGGTTLDLVFQ